MIQLWEEEDGDVIDAYIYIYIMALRLDYYMSFTMTQILDAIS